MEVGLELIGRNKFDYLVSSSRQNSIEPKPSPEGLIYCMNQIDSTASSTIMVGNGLEDMLCAEAAGALPVLITRGEHKLPVGKWQVIKSLYELNNLI